MICTDSYYMVVRSVLSGENDILTPDDSQDIDMSAAFSESEPTEGYIQDSAAAEKVVIAARRLYRMNKYTG